MKFSKDFTQKAMGNLTSTYVRNFLEKGVSIHTITEFLFIDKAEKFRRRWRKSTFSENNDIFKAIEEYVKDIDGELKFERLMQRKEAMAK